MSSKQKSNTLKPSGTSRSAATGRLVAAKATGPQKNTAFGAMRGTMIIKGDIVSSMYGKPRLKS